MCMCKQMKDILHYMLYSPIYHMIFGIYIKRYENVDYKRLRTYDGQFD